MYGALKYITYGHFYYINRYIADANLDACDNVISGKELSLEVHTSQS